LTPYSTRESAGLFVLQVTVAPTPEMLDDDIDVMMSSGEPLFRLDDEQAGPVMITAHPQMKIIR